MAANTFHWKSHYEHQLSHPLAKVDWIPGSFIFSYHSVFMYPLDLSSRDSSLGIVIKVNSFMGWLELFKFPERNCLSKKSRLKSSPGFLRCANVENPVPMKRAATTILCLPHEDLLFELKVHHCHLNFFHRLKMQKKGKETPFALFGKPHGRVHAF